MLKFQCLATDLQKAITIVERSTPSRTTASILENIYLSLRGNLLTLKGYDMELGIQYQLPIKKGDQDGEILVKAQTIASIISKLPPKDITITVDDNQKMKITGEHIDFEISCLSTNEYPTLPPIEQGQSIQVKVEDLKQLIARTLFSVSADDTRKFLNGVLAKAENDQLLFISTDGYRLSLKKQHIENQPTNSEVIIPSKAIQEIQKIISNLDSQQKIEIIISSHQVVVLMPSILIITRVLDGKFPDYKQLIPPKYDFSFQIPRKKFLEACERAHIVASFSHNVVRLTFTNDNLELRANAQAFGDFFEEIQVNRLSGQDEIRVSFNVKLVIDALKNTDSDDIRLNLNHGASPCLFEPISGGDYFYVVMPIRTNDFQQKPSTPTPEQSIPQAPNSRPEPQPVTSEAPQKVPVAQNVSVNPLSGVSINPTYSGISNQETYQPATVSSFSASLREPNISQYE
jgi:DNA polymerase III subunit beta